MTTNWIFLIRILGSPLVVVLCFCMSCSAQTKIWETTINGGGSFSSINSTVDLNGDGIQDLVIGGGKEAQFSQSGINAIDGKSGNVLWQLPSRSQIYGSAIFLSIDNIEGTDLIISGRDAQLLAINGKTGKLIWEFWPDSLGQAADSGWYNFYLPQLTEDINNDGIKDIVISNGGKASASSSDTLRPPGKLMLISGKTGKVISSIEMPDKRETYFSPLFNPAKKGEIFFGSGGETIGGSLWTIQLEDLLIESTSNIKQIAQSEKHGFIALPSFYINQFQNIEQMFLPVYSGEIIQYDLKTMTTNWTYKKDSVEAYVSPALGYFNNDEYADAVCLFAYGVYPFYTKYIMEVLDGKTGKPIFSKSNLGLYQLTSVNILDIDKDGIDEILLVKNYDVGFSEVQYRNQIQIFDINDDTLYSLLNERQGLVLYSTPFITNLNVNGNLDIILCNNNNDKNWYLHESFTLSRFQFDQTFSSISWPSYLGKDANGVLTNQIYGDIQNTNPSSISIIPNPVNAHCAQITANDEILNWELYDQSGKKLKSGKTNFLNLEHIQSGIYLVKIAFSNNSEVRRIVIL